MKTIIFATILFSVLSLSYATGIKEDKVYEVENSFPKIDSDLPIPDFLSEKDYTYDKIISENGIWHEFNLRENNTNSDLILTLPENISNIKPSETTLSEITSDFGLPTAVIIAEENSYYHLNIEYDEVSLYFGPSQEIINEIRFERPTSYLYKNITVGSYLEDVLAIFPPLEIIGKKEINWDKPEILYKDINGESGYHYIDYRSEKMRLFFYNDLITALYLY